MSAQPDASYKGTDSSGEVLIGLQTGSVIGTTGGGQEAAIPFTTTEAFEHEFSHIADGLSGLGNQSASGIISASGATVDVIRGGVNHGATEACAVNRTNTFRTNSGLNTQRTRY